MLKYSESFSTLKKARRRESEIKGWRREKKLALIKKIKIEKDKANPEPKSKD